MKKLIPILVVAAGAAAYMIAKKKKSEEDSEVKIITLEEPDEEDKPKEESSEPAETKNEILNQILRKFPYLKQSFIEETLEYAKNFDQEYPLGSRIRINHVVKFVRVEELITFVQTVRREDYAVQEAQEENTILAFKEFQVEEGMILNEVFRIADQAGFLDGEYFGFQIDKL